VCGAGEQRIFGYSGSGIDYALAREYNILGFDVKWYKNAEKSPGFDKIIRKNLPKGVTANE
jgi:hypothetical protein